MPADLKQTKTILSLNLLDVHSPMNLEHVGEHHQQVDIKEVL